MDVCALVFTIDPADAAGIAADWAAGELWGRTVLPDEEFYISPDQTEAVILGAYPAAFNHSWPQGDIVHAIAASTYEQIAAELANEGYAWIAEGRP